MSFLGIILLLSCHLCRSAPVVADPVKVQIQQWGVVGSQQVEKQVLLDGISFTSQNQEFTAVVKKSADTLLTALISANKTPALRNHTILRSQECILEESSLRWSDSVLNDGQVYLTLQQNNVWTVHVPQALTLKVVWDRVMQQTGAERVRLQEGCAELMKNLKFSAEQSDPEILHLQYLIPILALIVFVVLCTISIFIYKRRGLRHPGGIIGSIIHYPKWVV